MDLADIELYESGSMVAALKRILRENNVNCDQFDESFRSFEENRRKSHQNQSRRNFKMDETFTNDIDTLVCFQCERKGHMKRDCPEKVKMCYNCNEIGHFTRECPEPARKRSKKNDGNKKMETTIKAESEAEDDAKKSEMVKKTEKPCFVCGSLEHLKVDCPKRAKPDGKKDGGSIQKKATNKDDKGMKSCWDCGKSGHIARDCPVNRLAPKNSALRGGGGGGGGGSAGGSANRDDDVCFRCGKPGHFAKECDTYHQRRPQSPGPANVLDLIANALNKFNRDGCCYLCGQPGHFARECREERGLQQQMAMPYREQSRERFRDSPRDPYQENSGLGDRFRGPEGLMGERFRGENIPGLMGSYRSGPNDGSADSGPREQYRMDVGGLGYRRGGGGGGQDSAIHDVCGPPNAAYHRHPLQQPPQRFSDNNLVVPEGLNVNNPCLTCGRINHVTFDCPLAKLCYRCGMTNHIARDCSGPRAMAPNSAGDRGLPTPLMNRDRMNSLMGPGIMGTPNSHMMNGRMEESRMAMEHQRSSFRTDENRGHRSFESFGDYATCNRCGRRDHDARDCLEMNNTCLKCGETGHMTYNCHLADPPHLPPPSQNRQQQMTNVAGGTAIMTSSRASGDEFVDMTCYRCGRVGHAARDCSQEKTCYKCNREGHIARDCPRGNEEIQRGGGGGNANRFRVEERGRDVQGWMGRINP